MTPQVKTAAPPGTTTPAPATPSTPAAAAPEPPALEYQSLTVEQILNQFQKELEQDSVAYLEQAKRVCEYDAVVRDSQRDLVDIANQTQRLMLEQEQIEHALLSVNAFQKGLEQTLEEVSTDVDALFTSQSHLAPQDADVERERAYQLSQTITQRLDELELNLGGTIATLSSQAENLGGGSSNSMLTILNQHQNAIGALEGAAHRLETDATHVGRLLAAPSR
jgi:nuclear pore complex protein Nup62